MKFSRFSYLPFSGHLALWFCSRGMCIKAAAVGVPEKLSLHQQRLASAKEEIEFWRKAGLEISVEDLPFTAFRRLRNLKTTEERLAYLLTSRSIYRNITSWDSKTPSPSMNNFANTDTPLLPLSVDQQSPVSVVSITSTQHSILDEPEQIITNDMILLHINYVSRIRDKKHWQNLRMLCAVLSGSAPELVIDFSLTHMLFPKERGELMSQLCRILATNSDHKQPFVIRFCGVDESLYWQEFRHSIPEDSLHNLNFFKTSQSYLDVFPKERLVYLTPDSHVTLEKFDSDNVYIIGALVDLNCRVSTYDKACSQGIATAKLPLDSKKIPLKCRQKMSLCEVHRILLDLHSGDSMSTVLSRNILKTRTTGLNFNPKMSKWQRKKMTELLSLYNAKTEAVSSN